jgi:ubiquinone/menaquinone biosynthesis C-methylase UbiE
MENYELFDSCEFPSWSQAQGLQLEERYLFDKYIFPRCRAARVLEVGTGNGRLLFASINQGFTYGTGIDLVSRLLSVGKDRAQQQHLPVDLLLMDAVELGFKDQQFHMVLALQQIMSFIPIRELRIKAIKECYRVLQSGGFAIFSFLHFPGRWYNKMISPLFLPFKILRREYDFINYRYLPWLKFGRKINLKYVYEKQPYLYWFTLKEVLEVLEMTGFRIIDCLSSKMIRENRTDFIPGGMLYLVATKL